MTEAGSTTCKWDRCDCLRLPSLVSVLLFSSYGNHLPVQPSSPTTPSQSVLSSPISPFVSPNPLLSSRTARNTHPPPRPCEDLSTLTMAKTKPIYFARRRKVVRVKLERVKVLKTKKAFISTSKERKHMLAYLWRELKDTFGRLTSASNTGSTKVEKKKLPHPAILSPAGMGSSIYRLIQTLSWGPFRQHGARILAPSDIDQLSKLTGIELSGSIAENDLSIRPIDTFILNDIIKSSSLDAWQFHSVSWDFDTAMFIETCDINGKAFFDMVKCFYKTAVHYQGLLGVSWVDVQDPYLAWIQTAQIRLNSMALGGSRSVQQPGPLFFFTGLTRAQCPAVVITTYDSKTKDVTFSESPIELEYEEQNPRVPALYQSELLALLILLQKRIDEPSLLRAMCPNLPSETQSVIRNIYPNLFFETQTLAMVINITATHTRVVEAIIPDLTSNRLIIRLLENKAHDVLPESNQDVPDPEYLADVVSVNQNLNVLRWLFGEVKGTEKTLSATEGG
ncbi:hypothetical protein V8F20_005891 [Naviculisporaceae sp. PSN 640]